MNLLLDTQVFLWSLNQDERTPTTIRTAIQDPANLLHLSIASLWEATIKIGLGKLDVPGDSVDSLLAFAEITGTNIIPIRPEHLRVLQTLPRLHRDPFDRILVCQSRCRRTPFGLN